MRVVSQPRRLWKQSSVRQRDGEIRVGFPLDTYSAVNQVVADLKARHPHVEDTTVLSELEQGRISLRIVHIESVTLTVHNGGRSGLRDDDDDLVSLGQIDPFDACGHSENVDIKGKRKVSPSS
jgi:hypothetical protein